MKQWLINNFEFYRSFNPSDDPDRQSYTAARGALCAAIAYEELGPPPPLKEWPWIAFRNRVNELVKLTDREITARATPIDA